MIKPPVTTSWSCPKCLTLNVVESQGLLRILRCKTCESNKNLFSGRYDVGRMLLESNLYIKYNAQNTKGPAGVLAEFTIRALHKPNSYVCRASFRRACKRHSCSQTEARQLLRDVGMICERACFTYQAQLKLYNIVFKTQLSWECCGYRINKGEESYAVNLANNVPLYSSLQVEKRND